MYPDSKYAVPIGSFQVPVPPPTGHWYSEPLVQVCFSETWLPYVVGCLKQLLLEATWGQGNPTLVKQLQQEAFELIDQFANPPVDNLCDVDKADWYIEATEGLEWSLSLDTQGFGYNGSISEGIYNVTTAWAFDQPMELHGVDRANPSLNVGGIWRHVRVVHEFDSTIQVLITLCDDSTSTFSTGTPWIVDNALSPSGGWKSVQIVPVFGGALIATVAVQGLETCSPV